MNKLALVFAAPLVVTAVVAKEGVEWDFKYEKFMGEFAIYSGQLGETMPPTRSDRKLSMMVEGELAREMFDSMGPDLKEACGAGGGNRIRRKQKVSCSYFPTDGYTCYIGINLRTGESIPGSIC